MHRRSFLALACASGLRAQRGATTTAAPGAPLPPPPAARITSAVVLSSLKGTFEERVRIVAIAGIQSIELTNEHASWDDATAIKARRFTEGFNVTIDTIAALPDLDRTMAIARKLNCAQIFCASAPAAPPDAITFLLDRLPAVQEADNPRVRLAFPVRADTTVAAVKDAVDYAAVFRVTSPGDNNLKEIYQAIQKSGYSRYVALDYTPSGDPVASLIKSVDAFRAALLERPLVTSG